MAITSLAPRTDLSQKLIGGANSLGPGAYLGHKSYEILASCAPFGCTAPKFIESQFREGPDPGTYHPAVPSKRNYTGTNTVGGLGPGGATSGQGSGNLNSCFIQTPAPFQTTAKRFKDGGSSSSSSSASGGKIQPIDDGLTGPGPGGYNIQARTICKNNDDKKEATRTLGKPITVASGKKDREDFEKQSKFARPSIPKPNQSYGYGEGPGGVLVKQDRPYVVTNGDNNDKIASNHYNIREGCTRKRIAGGAFPISTRKGLSNVQDIPGPGHYQATRSAAKQSMSGFGAAFKSGTKRGIRDDSGENDVGPAGLLVTKPSKTKSFHRTDCQFFGSTQQRFKAGANGGSGGGSDGSSSVPGPGQYSRLPGALRPDLGGTFCNSSERWKSKKKKLIGSQQSNLASNTTSGSLNNLLPNNNGNDLIDYDSNPGPGTYDVNNVVSFFDSPMNKSFSTLTNMGSYSFGGTARRFPHSPSKDGIQPVSPKTQDQIERGIIKRVEESENLAQHPGPGSYILPTAFKDPEDIERNTSSFQKPLKKSTVIVREGEVRPSPWAYNPKIINTIAQVTRLPPKNEGFLVSSSRFGSSTGKKESEIAQGPGPGQYAAKVAITARGNTTNRSANMSFSTTAERFQERSKGGGIMAPGPGEYVVSKMLGTKSHNVLFNRELVHQ